MVKPPRFAIDFLDNYSDEAILAELRRIAAERNSDSLSRREVDEFGRVSSRTVIKRFGSMRGGLQKAGLRPARFTKASDPELLDILVELWVKTLENEGRRPYQNDLDRFGYPVSYDTIGRRFGSWRKALLRAAEYADAIIPNEIEAELTVEAKPRQAPRRGLSIRKRFFVLKRDRYRCILCGASAVPIEVDHILPVAKGGSDRLDNLHTLCVPCNRGKRDSLE